VLCAKKHLAQISQYLNRNVVRFEHEIDRANSPNAFQKQVNIKDKG
jgi:hypothetical protein